MKNWKRLLALFLSGAMALSLIACGATPQATNGGPSASPALSAAPSGDPAASASPEIVADLTQDPLEFAAGLSAGDILLTVNGEDIPADLMLYWLSYACNYFMYSYGVYGLSMADYGDQLVNDAVAICVSEVLLRQKAAQLGCLPTDAQMEEARKSMEDDPDTLDLFRNSYGLTDQSIQYLFLADAYYDNMLDAVTHEPSEAELEEYIIAQGLYRVKHILLKTVDDNRQPLADDQIAAKKAQAEDFLSQLQKAGEGEEMLALFDQLMNEHSEDGRTEDGALAAPDGYLASPGQMVAEFEEAGKKLKAGELSGIVETTFGYHILLGLPLTPFTDEEKAEYRESFRPAALQDQADQWTQEADIVRADALTQVNPADFYARLSAYQQALKAQNTPAQSGAPVESGTAG